MRVKHNHTDRELVIARLREYVIKDLTPTSDYSIQCKFCKSCGYHFISHEPDCLYTLLRKELENE